MVGSSCTSHWLRRCLRLRKLRLPVHVSCWRYKLPNFNRLAWWGRWGHRCDRRWCVGLRKRTTRSHGDAVRRGSLLYRCIRCCSGYRRWWWCRHCGSGGSVRCVLAHEQTGGSQRLLLSQTPPSRNVRKRKTRSLCKPKQERKVKNLGRESLYRIVGIVTKSGAQDFWLDTFSIHF